MSKWSGAASPSIASNKRPSPPSPGTTLATLRPSRRMVARSHMAQNFGEAMRDEEHRAAAALPLAHHREDMLGLIGRKGCSDLVEKKQLRIVGQGP